MGSILTNNSAMVALQTLTQINKGLNKVQSEISTGMRVSNARDNASVWAIASTMRSDVKGFDGISDSLATASATIAVARAASESLVDVLTEMKGKIVAAQSDTADRAKLQADIDTLVEQVGSVVDSAQFNGLNLVNGTGNMSILASLNRDQAQAVTAGTIAVAGIDLSSEAGAVKAALVGSINASTDGSRAAGTIDDLATGDIVIADDGMAAGDKFKINVGDQSVTYTVTTADITAGTSTENVAAGIRAAILSLGITDLNVQLDGATSTLTLDNQTGADLFVSAEAVSVGAGGLSGLQTIDVTGGNHPNALADIEALIQTSVNAAAAFGSAQARVDIQADFMTKLTDSLKSGIGSLVDADLEEASARLQSLQVQQQLGTQALSIANQAPQSVLALFR